MIVINDEYTQRFIKIERQKNDIKEACEFLEEALIFQFQQISLGLFTDYLLREGSISDKKLLSLSISLFNNNDPYSLIESTRKYLLDGIAQRKWKTITLSDLYNIEIRIFNGYVKIYDEFRINEQLARLGSSLRLYMPGGINAIKFKIREFFSASNDYSKLDARFIFGKIGNVSICYFAHIFEFIQEFAISPYFPDDMTGLNIGNTAMTRAAWAKFLLKNSKDNLSENEINALAYSDMIHELTHIVTLGSQVVGKLEINPYYWEKISCRDVFRFLQKPYTFDDMYAAFELNFNSFIVNNFREHGVEIVNTKNYISLDLILEKLVMKNKIFRLNDGTYICNLYREGQKWDLI